MDDSITNRVHQVFMTEMFLRVLHMEATPLSGCKMEAVGKVQFLVLVYGLARPSDIPLQSSFMPSRKRSLL